MVDQRDYNDESEYRSALECESFQESELSVEKGEILGAENLLENSTAKGLDSVILRESETLLVDSESITDSVLEDSVEKENLSESLPDSFEKTVASNKIEEIPPDLLDSTQLALSEFAHKILHENSHSFG